VRRTLPAEYFVSVTLLLHIYDVRAQEILMPGTALQTDKSIA